VLSELVVKDGGPSGGHAAGRLFREVVTFLLVVLVPLLALAGIFPRQGVELFTDFESPSSWSSQRACSDGSRGTCCS